MKKTEIYIAFIISLLAIAAFLVPTYGQEPLYGGSLTIAYYADPVSFNGILNPAGNTLAVGVNIFSRLLKYDGDYNIVPDIAASWEMSDDGRNFTFYLVDNATWHDGHNFTSADVKFHYELLMEYNASHIAAFLQGLESIETIDDYVVVFHFNSLLQPSVFADNHADQLILPKHIFEGTDLETNPANWEPIGTGPFKFVEYAKDSHIILEANDEYFKGRPYLDNLYFQIITQKETALVAFEAKEVDYICEYLGVPSAEIPRVREIDGVVLYGFVVPTNVQRLLFNYRPEALQANPWLGDVNVRRAIGYAINRSAIVENVLYGVTEVCDGPISNILPYYNPALLDIHPQYDPQLAEQLLDNAGYPRVDGGTRFTAKLLYWIFGETQQVAEVIKEMLRNVGIEVQLEPVELTTYLSEYWFSSEGLADYPMNLIIGLTGPDPLVMNKLYLSTATPDTGTGNNIGWYSNLEVDSLLEDAANAVDFDVRKGFYYEAQELMVADMPAVYLYSFSGTHAWWDEYAGFEDSLAPSSAWGTFARVWWTQGSPISPEAAWAAIEKAEEDIGNLEAQFYDVSAAREKLAEAKDAYNNGDWLEASNLANDAVGLAQPPYIIYAVIVAVVVIAIVAVVFMYRRKKSK